MTDGRLARLSASWGDYLEMCKPRVVLLMLLTTLVGMLIAVPGATLPEPGLLVAALSGIALVAGSAAVINHVADAHIDRKMARTHHRPMAQGRVSLPEAIVFSAVIGSVGMLILITQVNVLTAWLNLISWAGYGLLYTLYLKRRTPQNIVLGGLFGAAPPLFGWTAVTGEIALTPLVMVLIIFVWTPPHFWALALDRMDEYAETGVPMLPITHGDMHTRWNILAYTGLLVLASLIPFAAGALGWLYLGAAAALGGIFVHHAIAVMLKRPGSEMGMFRYSIVYLGVLFGAMLADHHGSALGGFA